MEPAPVAEPYAAAELARDLQAVREWSARYWGSFAVADFFAPIGKGWSPAGHVRHLVKSNRPVAVALGIPKPVLALRFGSAGGRRGATPSSSPPTAPRSPAV